MDTEGKWWVLIEDEPVDLERSRLYELVDGTVFDGRTGAPLGSYVITAKGAELTLAHASGDSTIVKMHAGELADRCIVDWSTAGYELYCASLPPHGQETEEQEFARQDWEDERFGSRVTYGLALRDSPELREDVGADPSHAATI